MGIRHVDTKQQLNKEMQGQHQPAMSRLVKEMKAVVGRTRPIVGGGGGTSNLFYSTEVDTEMH